MDNVVYFSFFQSDIKTVNVISKEEYESYAPPPPVLQQKVPPPPPPPVEEKSGEEDVYELSAQFFLPLPSGAYRVSLRPSYIRMYVT